ncbi:hypothetical protein ACSBR2_032368 [Camellia fascicularis]
MQITKINLAYVMYGRKKLVNSNHKNIFGICHVWEKKVGEFKSQKYIWHIYFLYNFLKTFSLGHSIMNIPHEFVLICQLDITLKDLVK